MILTIDFETRSECDLKKCGAYRYAEDPSTEILCLAVKVDAEPAWIWDTGQGVVYLNKLVQHAKEIHAHNAAFERVIWRNKMLELGFKDIPLEKWRCTAAQAAACGLPRDLHRACLAMHLPIQKDEEGHKLMMKMCKPRRPTKKDASKWYWTDEAFQRLCQYCKQDVEAEYCLGKALPPLSAKEQQVWFMDQRINDRGVLIDLETVAEMKRLLEDQERNQLEELDILTEGKVATGKQRDALLEFMAGEGLELADLKAQTVEDALKGELPNADLRRLLELRQSLGKSSTAKLDAMERYACADGRARGVFLYHGASTGRWASRGVQLHNMPRGKYEMKDLVPYIMFNVHCGVAHDEYDLKDAMIACLRSLLYEPVRGISCGDFSAIEARILAWLADEVGLLNLFRAGKDVYITEAARVYGIPESEVTKDQRQIGKISDLACGYQGSIGSFHSMSANYGVKVTDEEALRIIRIWRKANPNIVRYWYATEDAAINAIKEPGKSVTVGKVKWGVSGNFLMCLLPSGRLLKYPYPRLEEKMTPWGQMKLLPTYMTTDDGKWVRTSTYGGSLVENVTQAVARDVIVETMLEAENQGVEILMHVHDEIVAIGEQNLKKILDLMQVTPEWADGLPMGSAGWSGKRYKKD